MVSASKAYLKNNSRVIDYPTQFAKSALETSNLILDDKSDYAVNCKNNFLRNTPTVD